MPKYCLRDLDIVYISYDEPKCDEFYENLLIHAPHAKRVHKVLGFDRAHKLAAKESTTARFITIDGDNLINPNILNYVVDDDEMRDVVFSFKAENMMNGLAYGNGGVKVWPRQLVLEVDTHEKDKSVAGATDFCWKYRYYQVDQLGSTVHCNQSKYQAFRAGYREGVKLSIVDGMKSGSWQEVSERIAKVNYSRLMVWASVGADVKNGWWSIYGTRKGIFDTWVENQDINLIRDYNWFDEFWDQEIKSHDPKSEAIKIGDDIFNNMGLFIMNLDHDESEWFKKTYINPSREGLMFPDMPEVDFSYDD